MAYDNVYKLWDLALICLCVTMYFRESVLAALSVCVVRGGMRSHGCPRAGVPSLLQFPPLATVPEDAKTQAQPTQPMQTCYSSLMYRRSPLTYWIFIYLLRTSLVSWSAAILFPLTLSYIIPHTFSRPIYCLVHSFLKQNVNMWHDHHGWPPTALRECGFVFIFWILSSV